MSLKSYLSALLDSHLTSNKSYVSNQSYPSGTRVTFSCSDSTYTTYTAPSDGWITLNESAFGSLYNVHIYTDKGVRICINNDQGKSWSTAYVPISKGDTAHIYIANNGATSRQFAFISSIGNS
jgi:hypothetical protein